MPAIEVGSGIVPTEAFSLPLNLYSIVYAFGSMVALWLFVKSVSSLVKLVKESESEILMGELVLRSDKAGPFSFLSIIHLPKKLSATNLETILRHEMAHVQLGHSYDVLWLSFLRILFWFNPLLLFFKNALQEAKTKISEPIIKTSLVAKNEGINHVKKIEQTVIKADEALQIAESLLSNIHDNQSIAFSSEKVLLNYLKETNNEQVYQFIIEKLQTANKGNESDDRLIEYSLSLLAAVDSLIASEIFFDFVAKDNWQGSNAIYTIRKSIEKLNRNGN